MINSFDSTGFKYNLECICVILTFFVTIDILSVWKVINPLMKNILAHHYHLDKSIFIFRGIRSDF